MEIQTYVIAGFLILAIITIACQAVEIRKLRGKSEKQQT